MRQVTWNGKDLAAVQMLAAGTQREHGMPNVRVDSEWNLSVMTADGLVPVAAGQLVVADDGRLSVATLA
jgi:hypothetical protein